MVKWAESQVELVQVITPDGETIDLTTGSDKGDWVINQSGWGMPDIDYQSQQGPFQHGVSVRDYRLKPRTVQLLIRQQACDRDNYWEKRTALLNTFRVNRDPIDITGMWVRRSQDDLESQNHIYTLCEYNGKLYGATGTAGGGGMLFEWDGVGKWILVADTSVGEHYIWDMIVYDDGTNGDRLYGCSGSVLGQLRYWDVAGRDWDTVCTLLNAQTDIRCLAIFDAGLGGGDQIYGGTSPGGRLFVYQVGVGWAQVCAQLGAETSIFSLCVYDDGGGEDLYGGTGVNGLLYRYNVGGAAWVAVCAQLNAQTIIYTMVVYNGQLYAGTGPNGLLFRYNVGGGAWTQVAAQYAAVTTIRRLRVYQGRLYGVGDDSRLLRWNDADAWELVAEGYGGILDDVESLCVFNNRLFGGQDTYARLLEYVRRSGDTTLPCTVLRRVLSDGSIRDLCGHIVQGPIFDIPEAAWDEWGFKEVLRFWAPDPIIYDPEEQDGPTYTMDPLATGSVLESQTVTYTGTWEEHPVFVLTGPMENPIIRNEDTDEFIELDYNIAAAEIVTITLTPGSQTIENDDGLNLIGVVTPESNFSSFHLAPDPEVTDGENEIKINASGTNANTDFSFTYYNRYIGI